MAKRPHALVIGGSVGGLMAGLMLIRGGWNVTVFERSAGDLSGRGAGLGISEEMMDCMRRVGAPFDASGAAVIESRDWLEADGSIRYSHRRPSLASAWPRIYQPLRAVFPNAHYRAGMTLERVDQTADAVLARFTDGSIATGDLLVGADGSLSTVRRQFLPELTPSPAGYVAWRGIVEERDLPEASRRKILGRILFSFPDGEMMLTMPSPGADDDMRPGHRRCYFIWYRPADANRLRDLFTDASGQRHHLAMPPPLIRPEFVREIKEVAPKIFAPEVAAAVTLTTQPLLQAISDLAVPTMIFGRVALLGDAAFVARPHVASGTTKAALDAATLADELVAARHDVPTALAAYNEKQHRFGSALAAHARHLGAYLEGQAKPLAERRGEELARQPDRIIDEYGAPHLLHDADFAKLAADPPGRTH